jgi:hypothetical protein
MPKSLPKSPVELCYFIYINHFSYNFAYSFAQ